MSRGLKKKTWCCCWLASISPPPPWWLLWWWCFVCFFSLVFLFPCKIGFLVFPPFCAAPPRPVCDFSVSPSCRPNPTHKKGPLPPCPFHPPRSHNPLHPHERTKDPPHPYKRCACYVCVRWGVGFKRGEKAHKKRRPHRPLTDALRFPMLPVCL